MGDGSLVSDGMENNNRLTMEHLDLPRFAARYGEELLDFIEGPTQKVALHDLELKINRAAWESGFLISLPALKTQPQCKDSLAQKNLKGCLHLRSRAACHGPGSDLDRNGAMAAKALCPDLGVIDGHYSLARGLLATGHAWRTNLLIPAGGALDARLAGVEVLGCVAGELPPLVRMVDFLERVVVQTPQSVGPLCLDEILLNLPYSWDWDPESPSEPFNKHGVNGVLLAKYDASLCTGCSLIFNPIIVMTMAAGAGQNLGWVEILAGKTWRPRGKARRKGLMGNCIIERQRQSPLTKEAVLVKGCLPSLPHVVWGMNLAGLAAGMTAFDRFMGGLGKGCTPEKAFLTSDFAAGRES